MKLTINAGNASMAQKVSVADGPINAWQTAAISYSLFLHAFPRCYEKWVCYLFRIRAFPA
jgi:hypothetical protein